MLNFNVDMKTVHNFSLGPILGANYLTAKDIAEVFFPNIKTDYQRLSGVKTKPVRTLVPGQLVVIKN